MKHPNNIFSRYLAHLLLASLVFGDVCMRAQAQESKAPPVIWGDITRDGVVDLKDLNRLARDWNDPVALASYAPHTPTASPTEIATRLRDEISLNWQKSVPGILRKLGWSNRNMVVGPTIGGKSAFSKGSLPIAIGTGITVSDDTVDYVTASLPIFRPTLNDIIPVDPRPANDVASLGIRERDVNNPRYVAPIATSSQSKYMYSFAEEASFRGFDVSVNARFAAAKGSLDQSFKSQQYKSERKHIYISKLRKDFGWFFVPPDDMGALLTEGFKNDIKSPDPEFVRSRYGTHYVYAVHKFSELHVTVEIDTTQTKSRSEMETTIKAKIGGGLWSASAQSNLRNLAETSSNIGSVVVRIDSLGGPQVVNIDGKNYTFPIAVDIFDQSSDNLLAKMLKLQQAWSASPNNLAGNAGAQDYYLRPLSDFLDESTRLPYSRDNQLRNWFEWYIKYLTVHNEIYQDIYDETQNRIRTRYRYFEQSPLPQNLASQYSNWPAYFDWAGNYYDEKLRIREQEGRKLLESADALFDESTALREFTEVQKPLVFATLHIPVYEFCDSTFNYGRFGVLYKVLIHGGDFRQSAGYQYQLYSKLGYFSQTFFATDHGSDEPPYYNEADRITHVRAYGGLGPSTCSQRTYIDSYLANEDAVFIIRDLRSGQNPGPIVFQQCLNATNCAPLFE